MTKPFHLQPLLNLAQIKNESATRKLGQLNKQQHDTQAQLEILQQYRKDYQTRMQESSRNAIDPALLRNFQEFINKLDLAIAQQIKAVEQSKLSTQMGRGEFSNTQRKLKSFDTLQQRHIETQSKAEAKLEQRAMDEHTGRSAAYKMRNTENK
ncbi:MAG: flagellar export protein FliJ [Gallionella sp.]|jgi:flagellar FliJ protein|nr:flagellar export protein FliJ [Gallionella sp.]MDP1940003.1 flagellar export protein FliJ [Gallionella sp.]